MASESPGTWTLQCPPTPPPCTGAASQTTGMCLNAPTIHIWCPDGSSPSNAWCTALNVAASVNTVCKPVPLGDSVSLVTNVDNIKGSSFAGVSMASIITAANTAPLSNVLYSPVTPYMPSNPNFPVQISGALEGCTTSTCPYIAADFNTNTTSVRQTLPYIIDTSVTAPVDAGVFVSTTAPISPVRFTSPSGFTYKGGNFSGTGNSATSIFQCVASCKTGCTAFMYDSLNNLCQIFSDTSFQNASTGGNYNLFVPDTIPTTASGTIPPGVDFSSSGNSCDTVTACNTDLTTLINNSGTTVASFATSEISSCSMCPVRTYNSSSKVIQDEIGIAYVSSNPISDLLYKTGSGAAHVTVSSGFYTCTPWISGSGAAVSYTFGMSLNSDGTFTLYSALPQFTAGTPYATYYYPGGTRINNMSSSGQNPTVYLIKPLSLNSSSSAVSIPLVQVDVTFSTVYNYFNTPSSFNLVPIDYVTNGFMIQETTTGQFISRDGTTLVGAANKYTPAYNNMIFVLNPTNSSTFFSVNTPLAFTNEQYKTGDNNGSYVGQYPMNPLIYKNSSGNLISFNQGSLPNQYKTYYSSWVIDQYPVSPTSKYCSDFTQYYSTFTYVTFDAYGNIKGTATGLLSQFISVDDGFVSLFTNTGYVPDPTPNLPDGRPQFKTLTKSPYQPTAQNWANGKKQGCGTGCSAYVEYQCTGQGRGNCDCGAGACVSGPVCNGTHVVCAPNEPELSQNFTESFAGLVTQSTSIVSGASGSSEYTGTIYPTYSTDHVQIVSLYTYDTSFKGSVNTTNSDLLATFDISVVQRIQNNGSYGNTCASPLDWSYNLSKCVCPGLGALVNGACVQPASAQNSSPPTQNSLGVWQCPAGQYMNVGVGCVICASGSYAPQGTTDACIPCPAGQYSVNPGSSSCSQCQAGYGGSASLTGQTSSQACQACSAGSYSITGSPCTQCPAGQYQLAPSQSSCFQCSPGTYSGIGATSCTTCAAGTVSVASGASSCTMCSSPTIADPSHTICWACPPGNYAVNGVAIPCPAGTANPNTNSTSASACVACGSGTYSSQGASVCLTCGAGATVSGTTACNCNTGYGTLVTSGTTSTCSICPQGYYSPGGTTNDCNECPHGFTTISTGSASTSSCNVYIFLSCPILFPYLWYQANGPTFTECATGPLGSGSPGSCLMGMKKINTPSTNPNIGTVPYTCSLCLPGQYSNDGITCQNCPANTYNPYYGLGGLIGATTTCYPCGPGQTSVAGSATCACPQASCTCPAGQYRSDPNTCLPCPQGTSTSAANNSGISACTPCAVGYYADGNGCIACPAGQYQDQTGQASCKLCPAGSGGALASAQTSSSVCTLCLAGYASALGTPCTACGPGTYSPSSGSASCSQCTNGATSTGTTNTSCPVCNSGYITCSGTCFPNSQTASATSISGGNTYINNPGTILASSFYCSNPYTQSPSFTPGASDWNVCYIPSYITQLVYKTGTTTCVQCNTQTDCPSGYTCDSSNHCNMCNAGTYQNGNSCTPCSVGQYSATAGSTSCTSCPVGQYQNQTGQSSCKTCPSGVTSSSGSSSCTLCTLTQIPATIGPGMICSSTTSCTGTVNPPGPPDYSCPSGWVLNNTGLCKVANFYGEIISNPTCYTCNIPSFITSMKWNGTACVQCLTGSDCPSGYVCNSNQCIQCTAGTYQNGSTCTSCPAGTYTSYAGSTSCTSCSVNTYTSSTGSTSCTTCPTNTYNPNTGSTSSSACVLNCPPGSYNNGTTCASCPTGTYSSSTGSTSCTSCPSGTFNPNQGSTSSAACQQCGWGSYSDTTGATSCKLCPAGTINYVSGSTSCQSCPAGSYTPAAGGYNCSFCYPGSYSSAVGATSCNSCSAGTFNPNSGATSCTSCSAGTYSSVGATSCTSCSAGTYSAAGASSCTSCSGGTYSSSAGATSCTLCPAGTSNGTTGATSCTTCPAGTYAPVGAWSCNPCWPGSYCPSAGSSSYSYCPAGTYTSYYGATSCTPCPAGTTNAGGQSSCPICAPVTQQATIGPNQNCITNSQGTTSCECTVQYLIDYSCPTGWTGPTNKGGTGCNVASYFGWYITNPACYKCTKTCP